MTQTTDGGRVIIRKKGSQQPISANKNWNFWKLIKNFELDELTFLITKRKNQLKYEKDPDKIRILRRDIRIIEDAYRIKLRKGEGNKIQEISNEILIKLGFKNDIYKEEIFNIGEKINLKYKPELVATCIIKEVLDYYNSSYSEEELLGQYRISGTRFYEAYIPTNNWCGKYHWK